MFTTTETGDLIEMIKEALDELATRKDFKSEVDLNEISFLMNTVTKL